MRITFLGSGGAFTDYRLNYQNNAIVETGAGPVLIDCGTTAAQSLRELGVPLGAVAAVLFTHLHADHASPEVLMWERFYGSGENPPHLKTRLVAPPDIVRPLCASLKNYMDEFTDENGKVRRGGLEHLAVAESTKEVAIGGVKFRWFRVAHVTDGGAVNKPAYGIEFDDGTSRVLWSGDTTFVRPWVEQAAADPRVVRIFHECIFLPIFRGTVHTHFEQLATLPEDVRAKITVMHHTVVPEGTDLRGIAGAAKRHESFDL